MVGTEPVTGFTFSITILRVEPRAHVCARVKVPAVHLVVGLYLAAGDTLEVPEPIDFAIPEPDVLGEDFVELLYQVRLSCLFLYYHSGGCGVEPLRLF